MTAGELEGNGRLWVRGRRQERRLREKGQARDKKRGPERLVQEVERGRVVSIFTSKRR